MTFEPGNQLWKLRTQHGREKLFSDPNALWESACEYFQWCDDNPLIQNDFKGRDADEVEIKYKRAYTWQGLCFFLRIDSFREYKTNPNYAEFSPIIKEIDKIMYEQKFSGAAAGLFNASIIARDLKLVDRSFVKTQKTKKEPDFSEFSKEELLNLAEKLEKQGNEKPDTDNAS